MMNARNLGIKVPIKCGNGQKAKSFPNAGDPRMSARDVGMAIKYKQIQIQKQ